MSDMSENLGLLVDAFVEILRFRDAADMQESVKEGIMQDIGGAIGGVDLRPGQKFIDEGRREADAFLKKAEKWYNSLDPAEQGWVRAEVERRWKNVKRPAWYEGQS